MKRVAVIGGGVAGMQTALRLAEQGIEPVIIEKEAELGGKLSPNCAAASRSAVSRC